MASSGMGTMCTAAVDAFATAANARFPVCWTASDDAFSRSWASSTRGTLWMNPPFSRMGEVLTKVERDGGDVVLVAPRWEDAPWWPTLLAAAVHIVPMPDEAIYLARGTVPVPRPTWRSVVARITCGAAPTAASAHSEPSPPTSGTLLMDVDTPSHPEGPLMATRPPTSATVPDAAAGRFPALAPLVDQPMETGPLMRAADARASLRVSNQTVATPATTGLEAPPGDGDEGPRTVPGSWHCPFNTYCRSNESR